MPIYEFRCEHGHTFEVMQRITDDPVSSCTLCEAPVERVFHPVAVHFKGSGFYTTDYGNRKRQREGKDGAEGSSSESSDTPSKKSDSSKSEASRADKSARSDSKAAA